MKLHRFIGKFDLSKELSINDGDFINQVKCPGGLRLAIFAAEIR